MSVNRQETVAMAGPCLRPIFALPFPLWILAPLLAGPGAADGRQGTDFVELHVARLSCVIGNNRALGTHAAGYNGIFRMAAPEQAQSPYVPFYAGINLENFFDARPRHPDPKVFFEPRNQPLTLTLVDDTTAELHQAATPYFGIESRMRFQLKPPYYVDYKYTCTVRKSGLAGGFFGVFWASYIDGPLDKSIHFLGKGATLDEVDHSYGLEMRVVYKPWSGRDDVLAEVRRYLAGGQ